MRRIKPENDTMSLGEINNYAGGGKYEEEWVGARWRHTNFGFSPYSPSRNSRDSLFEELDRKRKRFSPGPHILTPVMITPMPYNTEQYGESGCSFLSIRGASPSCLIRTLKINPPDTIVRFRQIACVDVTIIQSASISRVSMTLAST